MAAAIVVAMAWGGRAAKGHQPLTGGQDFLFPLDLNPGSDGGLLRTGSTVPLLSKSHSSRDHPCSPLTLWAPDTFLSAPIPREEVCFSAASQANQRRYRQAPLPQLQPAVCVGLPFTRAVFSLLKRSQLCDISKPESFAELETEGLASRPWLCQLRGKREVQNCSQHTLPGATAVPRTQPQTRFW